MKFMTSVLSLAAFNLFAAVNNQQAPITSKSDPNPCARFGTCAKQNFYVTGEAIWFKPIQKLEKSVCYTPVVDNDALANSNTSFFKHKFSPGFRVSLGYNTPYDGWDLNLVYTGLNYKHNNSRNIVKVDGAHPESGGSIMANEGALKVTYSYNLADLDLGRMFQVSQHLNLRPHFGLRSLWLNQKYSYTFIGLSLDSAYVKQKGNLVGLEGGLDSVWKLSKEFSLYANLGLACLVNNQKYKAFEKALSSDPYAPDSVTNVYNTSNYGTNVIANLDLVIGFRWDRNFSDDEYHLGINLGYELHDYININQDQKTYFFYNQFIYPNPTDFALQGIALGARFDF